jgi:hypothetical protein
VTIYSHLLAYDTVYLGRHTNIFEKIQLLWDVPLCCWMFSFWYFKGAYRGADKSLAWPGRKKVQRQKISMFIILFIIIIGGILVLFIYISRLASNEIFSPSNKIHQEVGRADKSLAWPGRKKVQRQKILSFIYPIYNHNWRNISTIYMYKTRLASNEIFSLPNKIHREVGRAKDLSAPR